MGGDEDLTDDDNYDGTQAGLIPGDNSLPLPSEGPPAAPDCPPNLTRIPADAGGDVPIVTPPKG